MYAYHEPFLIICLSLVALFVVGRLVNKMALPALKIRRILELTIYLDSIGEGRSVPLAIYFAQFQAYSSLYLESTGTRNSYTRRMDIQTPMSAFDRSKLRKPAVNSWNLEVGRS